MGLFSSGRGRTATGLTVIDQKLTIRGDIETEGAVRVDGRVEGASHRVGSLTIGSQGAVVGNIDATDVVVAGLVQGSIHASGRVEIDRGARVRGDVHARVLLMREGASINGKFLIESGTPEPEPHPEPAVRTFSSHDAAA